ncbi:hypothetical protein PV326_013988 [Microctonus aethiopoides]|nr:hypothetical protein PV326_013988 [Microctonus aethiopoides]
MKSDLAISSFLIIGALINIVTCQDCSKEDHQRCIAFADPLLKDPHLIFPDNIRDIDIVCRTWSNFVDCIKRYIARCFSKRRIDQFNAAVEAPITSVHQMCSVSTYQAEYLQYASCLKATVTDTQHCGDEYSALVQEVSKGEMARGTLCCTHHHFRTCVIRETRKRCDRDDSDGAASRYSRQILDRALNFLQDQCQNYMLNHGDCYNIATENSIELAVNPTDEKSASRSNFNNNRRPYYRTLSPDTYAGQSNNFHGGSNGVVNNPSSFRSTSRSFNDISKKELNNDEDSTIVTPDAVPHSTSEITEKVVTSELEAKLVEKEDEASTIRHTVEESAVVVTQRSPNYGRGISWSSPQPKTTTETPSWATSTWIASNQDSATESWYPAAGSFGGNNIDEPNQQGLKNGQSPKIMESPASKRLKMSNNEMNEPTQKSSNTTKTREINPNCSYYDWHYNQPFYVDKTLLIKELLKTPHLLISAPPRSGKTLNMDMARRFFEIEVDEDGEAIDLDVVEYKCWLKIVETRSKNFKLFKGKKILEEKEFVFQHFGKYPTIHVDFNNLDVPVQSMIYQNTMSIEDKRETIRLLQNVTKELLKWNESVARSLSNACLKFSNIILQRANNVSHHAFKDDKLFPKFYSFEETEVKYLLKKAGRLEDFNEIKEKCNGYKTTLEDGSHIELYNSWAVMNYLKTGNFDVYWPASILDKIKQTVEHDKIRPKIAKIMSNDFYQEYYRKWMEFSHIETLSKILCRNEVVKHVDADLFMQFLTEQGFFRSICRNHSSLCLEIPNRTVYSVFDEILGSIESINKYYNHSTELIEKLTDSFKDLARLRNEEAVHALTESIVALFRSGKTLKTRYELQSVLDAYILQKFQHVSAKCRTSLHAKCDTVLVIADLSVMFIIEYKSDHWDSNNVNQHISDRGCDTLAEGASLKEIFPEDTPTVQNRIRLEIQIDFPKISITYSFNNMEPNTVSKGGRN